MVSQLKIWIWIVMFMMIAATGYADERQIPEGHQSATSDAAMAFSPAETVWLNKHKRIRIGGPKAFPPFHFYDENGNEKGMAADYIRLFAKQLGLDLEIQANLPWPEVLEKAKNKEIDVIVCVARTEDRENYLMFTEPVLSFPMVIINRKDAPFVGGLHDLRGKKVATIRMISTQDWLRRDGIDCVPYMTDTPIESLEAVSTGRADAYLGNLAASSYLIEKKGLANLKIAAPTPYGNYDLSFAVRNDWPEMASILNKALVSVKHDTHAEIRNRWLSVRYEHGIRKTDVIMWVLGVVAVAGLLLIVFHFRYTALRKEINRRKHAEAALEAIANRQAAVSELGRKALGNAPPDSIMNDAVAILTDRLRIEYAVVLKFLPDRDRLLLYAGTGWKDGSVGNVTVGVEKESYAGHVLAAKKHVVVENFDTDPRFPKPAFLDAHGITGGFAIIIGDCAHPYGILGAYSAAPRQFSRDDANFLFSVANVLTSYIERRQRESQITKLNDLKEALLGTGDINEKLRHITDGVVDIFEADFARIWMIKKGDLCETGCLHALVAEGPHICRHRNTCLHLVASSGRFTHTDGSHSRVPFGCHKIGRVAAGHNPKLLTNDAMKDPMVHDHQWARKLGLASFAGYRLLSSAGNPLGVMALFRKSPISSDTDALLENVANSAAMTIQTALAEDALRQSEESMKSIFRAAPTGIGVTIDRILIRANDRLCEMVGYPEQELLGKSARILYQTDAEYDWVGQEKYDRIKAFGTGTVETRWRKSNGEMIDVLLSSTPIDLDDWTVGVTFTALDMTDRKKAEESLAQSERRLRAIFKAAENVSFVITDTAHPDPIVLEFSPGAEKIFGYDKSEIIGKPVTPLHLPEDMAKLPAIRQPMRENNPGFSGEITLVRKSGETFPALFTTYPLFDKNDRMFAILGVGIDIAEQKRLESQLQQAHKMEAIGTLAGGIAHEFNNMLNIIIGNAELATDDLSEGADPKRRLEEIKIAGFRARDVVRQLLSFSRKMEEIRIPVQINSVVRESVSLARASIPATIDIRTDIPEISPTVLADATQVHQIVINLCTNAAHAMADDGGVLGISMDEIRLDAEESEYGVGPGQYARLTVRDSGQGIRPDILERIFDPYFTTKDIGQGTGMGLAVVHGIVKRHSGAIAVESEPGKGTTFRVVFPTIRESVSLPDERPQPPRGTENILFVDDEIAIAEMGKLMLERLGYCVEIRTDPFAALQLVKDDPHRFDLVFTDMAMPGMTGSRLAEKILAVRADIPIVLCTGFSEKMDGEKAYRIGIKKYVEKPLNRLTLASAIRDALDATRESFRQDCTKR